MKEDLPLIIYVVRLNLEGLYTVWDAYPKNTDSSERTYGRCGDRIRNTPQLDMSNVHNHTQYHVQRGTRLRPHSDDAKMDQ